MAATRQEQIANNSFMKFLRDGVDGVSNAGKDRLEPRFRAKAARDATDTPDALRLPDRWTRDILGGKAISNDDALLTADHAGSVSQLPIEVGVTKDVTFLPVDENGKITLPVLNQTDTDLLGQVDMSWSASETEAPSENEPDFGESFDLQCHPLKAYFEVSESMLRRSAVELETYFKRLLRHAAMSTVNQSFLTGSGSGQPTGITNAENVHGVSRDSGGSVCYQDTLDVKHAPKVQHRQRARYVIADGVEKWFEEQADSDGRPVYVGNAIDAAAGILNGNRYSINDDSPAVGSKGDVLFGDWSQYAAGMEWDIVLRRSDTAPEVFRNDRVAFMAIMSVGGAPFNGRSFAILEA